MKIHLHYQEKNFLVDAIRGYLTRAWYVIQANTAVPQNKQYPKENYYIYRHLLEKLLRYSPSETALSLNKQEMDFLFSAAFCTRGLSEETRQKVLEKTNYPVLLANLHFFNQLDTY